MRSYARLGDVGGIGCLGMLGVDDEPGEPLEVRIRRLAPRPRCGGRGGLLCSDGVRWSW